MAIFGDDIFEFVVAQFANDRLLDILNTVYNNMVFNGEKEPQFLVQELPWQEVIDELAEFEMQLLIQ